MGALMEPKEEAIAIRELCGLSYEAKRWLAHHIRNACTPIVAACDCSLSEQEREDLVDKCVDHLNEDLRKIGC